MRLHNAQPCRDWAMPDTGDDGLVCDTKGSGMCIVASNMKRGLQRSSIVVPANRTKGLVMPQRASVKA
jgi:hypothetical protein